VAAIGEDATSMSYGSTPSYGLSSQQGSPGFRSQTVFRDTQRCRRNSAAYARREAEQTLDPRSNMFE
jgi:hypothetical protein